MFKILIVFIAPDNLLNLRTPKMCIFKNQIHERIIIFIIIASNILAANNSASASLYLSPEMRDLFLLSIFVVSRTLLYSYPKSTISHYF